MKAKYEALADDLKRKISALEPGTRLPPVRQMVQESGVSQFTVVRALEILEQEGYVIRRPTVGTYTSRPRRTQGLGSATRRILLLSLDICDMAFNEVLRRTLVERGYLPRIHYFDLRESPERWVPRVRADGILFLAACPSHAVPVLRKRGVPLVCQGVPYSREEVDCTYGDERGVGVMAARHLLELGHRRLAVLNHEPDTPDGRERIAGFLDEAERAAAQVRVLDCHAELHCDSRETGKRRIMETLEEGALDFTGLFAINDAGAVGALQAFYLRDIRVPDRVSVIGCDNRDGAAYLCPALTTFEFSHADRANGLVDILEERLQGNDAPVVQKAFEAKLIVRDSTGRAGDY
ncbi:MAG: substrate-binding domain-containing protein [Phycisphaerae bacterium]|nr:substrate-binding domain-containing protein [Phycisphaerae bacterium]